VRISPADLVSREIPLLMGLRYALTVYHPYRAMKALLGDAIRAYVDRKTSQPPSMPQGPGPYLDAADGRFLAQWDALQVRRGTPVTISLSNFISVLLTCLTCRRLRCGWRMHPSAQTRHCCTRPARWAPLPCWLLLALPPPALLLPVLASAAPQRMWHGL
jgi:hypothetical protein